MFIELASEMVRDSCIRFGCDCFVITVVGREFGRRYDLTNKRTDCQSADRAAVVVVIW